MSLVGELRICQVVDPLKTMKFLMPKRVLKQLGMPKNVVAWRPAQALAPCRIKRIKGSGTILFGTFFAQPVCKAASQPSRRRTTRPVLSR
jgi:hypothetical protein